MDHWMDRRRFLVGTAAAAGAIAVVPFGSASATPEAMAEAIKKVVGNSAVTEGRVTLDLPPLIENGNTVPLVVSVESPMTVADHVKAIHVFNEKNPQPNVISMQLGQRAGKASVSTRIRLSETQTVTAIAQMSDGSFRSHSANVIVTQGACLEDTP